MSRGCTTDLSRSPRATTCRSTTAAGWHFRRALPDRVLLIDGQPGPSVFGNETYYLETALRLRLPGDPAAASPSPYEPTRRALGRPG